LAVPVIEVTPELVTIILAFSPAAPDNDIPDPAVILPTK